MASLLFMIEQRRGSVLWGSTLYTHPAQPEEELLHLLNPKKWTKLCGAHRSVSRPPTYNEIGPNHLLLMPGSETPDTSRECIPPTNLPRDRPQSFSSGFSIGPGSPGPIEKPEEKCGGRHLHRLLEESSPDSRREF